MRRAVRNNMRFLVFGSLNIDHVYKLEHFVKIGETIASETYEKNEGGKGLIKR